MNLITILTATTLALAATPSATTLGPDAALKELKAGNTRFATGRTQACAHVTATRAQLTTSQAPDAIVLSCSDSRVPPEQVFDQGLGKIFTIRVAGNVLSDDAIASIEYAVANLGTRLIVVMGHESCGAVKAALSTPPGKDAGSPSLNHLVAEIRENLGPSATSAKEDALLRAPVKKNVSAVADELVKRSAIVREAVSAGKVKVTHAIYGLGSGKVEFWD